ncbi:DNA polymerase III subunit delta [Moraxella macacae 0408225]|uniref:DNA polymerase III subunit delta n=1 Tax=Moraxella macacae 0408225 TaxID=1230338 RepID=L2F665_9GAMM|nr:DNA polymerase III subunit delta [Moraxella macacae]ELA08522.1 DNA polymerase III subunit delta [Moraxella macacae 0408225]
MQQTFLQAYTQAQNAKTPMTGLWLLHGDEPLLSQWLIEIWQVHWKSANMSMQHMDIVSAKSWQDILAELNSLSLFDDKKVVIAKGNHKPDKEVLTELKIFSQTNQIDAKQDQNEANCLIVLMDKFDKKSQKSVFFQLYEKHGMVVDCQLYQERQRHDVLKAKAKSLGIELTPNAWQQLMIHTKHNLLSAYQTLWRLSYLYNPALQQNFTMVDELQLQDGLVSQSHFTTFDLSDAMLIGDVAKVVEILQHLKYVQEPETLVLWVIAKDIRILQALACGQSFAELGIWQSKQGLYQNALNRHLHHEQNFSQWTELAYRCDQAVKGLIEQPAWELLYQLALQVAGRSLFRS